MGPNFDVSAPPTFKHGAETSKFGPIPQFDDFCSRICSFTSEEVKCFLVLLGGAQPFPKGGVGLGYGGD